MTPRTWELYVMGHRTAQRKHDYDVGLICAVIANGNRDPRRSRAFRPQDFMPREPQTLEQQVAIVKALAAAFDGEVTCDE